MNNWYQDKATKTANGIKFTMKCVCGFTAPDRLTPELLQQHRACNLLLDTSNKFSPLPPISIGIDCGGATGIGVYYRRSQVLQSVHTTDFFGAKEILTPYKADAHVYVEIPPEFIYSRNNQQSGAVRDKHAINIGGNRREAQLLAEALRREGYSVSEVPPVRETKWNQEEFQQRLQTAIKTNQHCRDAARIAYYYAGRIVR